VSLRVSHDCYSGSSGTFNDWRTLVAEAAGLPPWWLMEGVWDPTDQYAVKRAQPHFARWKGIVPIPWEPYESDPLVVLLEHEDDAGILASVDCGPIADRLEKILPKMIEHCRAHAGQGMFRPETAERITRRFIHGLREAARLGEKVTFS
jgi:hypothetical protein